MIASSQISAARETPWPVLCTGYSTLTEPVGVAELEPSGGRAKAGDLPYRLRLPRRLPAPSRYALALFGLALGLRLVFSILMSNTFDEDEFVYLALGRDVAHGAVPYRDFAFFHPPGILAIVAFLNPLISWWWPLARLANVSIDSLTVVLVGWIGRHLYGRRAGWAAAILYAINPVVLVAAVRVDQEVMVTALGTIGLSLVVARRSPGAALLAGACLGAACWIKYPAAVFLPVYVLAAPRRALPCLLGFLAATVLLFLPYVGEMRQLYDDTVAWQLFHRAPIPLGPRLRTTLIFWLAVNPLALIAAFTARKPLWLEVGFGTGWVFIFTSSAYSHYFAPVAPFAALVGAPLAIRLIRIPRWGVVASCLAVTTTWALLVNLVPQRYIFISRFSDVRPVVRLLDRLTPSGTPILANRLEFAFLARRPWVAHYFWDDYALVTSRELVRRLPGISPVVLKPRGDPYGFPAGFTTYLRARYVHLQVRRADIWLPAHGRTIGRSMSRAPRGGAWIK